MKYQFITHLKDQFCRSHTPLELSWIDLTVEDIFTHKIETQKRVKAHSYVYGMIALMWPLMAASASDASNSCFSATATGTAVYPSNPVSTSVTADNSYRITGAANNEWLGIVIGTGTTAVAITDVKIETKINEGVGAGQMSHGAVSVPVPSTGGTTRRILLSRTFANNSGGSITVNECGIYARSQQSAAGSQFAILIARDIISGGVAVADGKVLTVQYTIGVTV